jgi:hypothetical protein
MADDNMAEPEHDTAANQSPEHVRAIWLFLPNASKR